MRCFILFIFLFHFINTRAQVENVWVKKTDFVGGKRERAVAFSIENFGYVGTGTDTAELVQKDFWKYDPTNDSWTQIADLPGAARRDAVGFSLNGLGYVGTGMSNHISLNGNKLNDFWSYNPISNSWDSLAPFPGNLMNGVYFSTGFALNGRCYICGGKTGASAYTSEFWEYKPSNNQWIQRSNFPGGLRYLLSSFSIGNYGYVGFGANQDVYKKDLYRYNPATNQWEQMPNLPGNERGGASTFVLQDKGYVCGGNDGGLLDDLWEFDPVLQNWELKAYYGGSERKNAIAFSVNNKAYVGLGKGYSGKKSSMYEYSPWLYLGNNEMVTSNLQIFPNPGRESITIQNYPTNTNKIICINALGQIQFERSELPEKNAFHDFPSGIYYLLFYSDDNKDVLSYKLIIE